MKCERCGYEIDTEKLKPEMMTKDPSYIGIWICPECKKVHFVRLEVIAYPVKDNMFNDTRYGRQMIGGTIYRNNEVVLDKEYDSKRTCVINGRSIEATKTEKPDIYPGSQTGNK